MRSGVRANHCRSRRSSPVALAGRGVRGHTSEDNALYSGSCWAWRMGAACCTGGDSSRPPGVGLCHRHDLEAGADERGRHWHSQARVQHWAEVAVAAWPRIRDRQPRDDHVRSRHSQQGYRAKRVVAANNGSWRPFERDFQRDDVRESSHDSDRNDHRLRPDVFGRPVRSTFRDSGCAAGARRL